MVLRHLSLTVVMLPGEFMTAPILKMLGSSVVIPKKS